MSGLETLTHRERQLLRIVCGLDEAVPAAVVRRSQRLHDERKGDDTPKRRRAQRTEVADALGSLLSLLYHHDVPKQIMCQDLDHANQFFKRHGATHYRLEGPADQRRYFNAQGLEVGYVFPSLLPCTIETLGVTRTTGRAKLHKLEG